MQRITEEDNVTFEELEYILNKNKLNEEEKDVDDEKEEEVQLWEIWFNDKNLILHTQNKVLVEVRRDLANPDQVCDIVMEWADKCAELKARPIQRCICCKSAV